MGKQRSRVAKKISSAVRPGPSTRGERSTVPAQATLPSTPSGSGAAGMGHTIQNPFRQRGVINLRNQQQCGQLLQWLSAPASSPNTSLSSQSTAGKETTTVENPLKTSPLCHASAAAGVEYVAHSEELFTNKDSFLEDMHTTTFEGFNSESLCTDSQPWDNMLSSPSPTHVQHDHCSELGHPPFLSIAMDDDETQIPEVALVSEEEWDDAAGDNEVADPTFEPPTVSKSVTQSSDEEEEAPVRVSPQAVAVSALPQAQTTNRPTATTPAVQTIFQAQSTARGKPLTSSAWAFFQKAPNSPTEVICTICKKKYSRGKNTFNLSTTVMTRHMATKHALVWQKHNQQNVATDSASTSATRIAAAGHAGTASATQSRAIPTGIMQGVVPQSTTTSTDSMSLCSLSQESTQLSVNEMWGLKGKWPSNNPKVKALNCSLAKLLAVEMLPYTFVESESFRSFVSLACPRYKVPSRHYFAKSAIPALQQHVADNITRSLKQSVSAKVHFTTDTWTSKHGNGRYLTLTAHWVNLVLPDAEGNKIDHQVVLSPRISGQTGRQNPSSAASSSSNCTVASTTGMESYQVPNSACRGKRRQAVLSLRSLGDRSHTGRQLWSALSDDFEKWLTPLNLEAGYVVSDNASNLLAALRQGELVHVPCMAHVLNLIVQRFLKKYPGLQSLLTRVREVCAHFRRAPTSSSRLMAQQQSLGLPTNRLICDVATRWNSTFQMVQRFCQQKRAVVEYAMNHRLGQRSADVGHFSPSEWDQLQYLCTVLSSFANATEMVSGDEALISISVPVVFLLEQTLQNLRREEHSTLESEEEEFQDDEPQMRPLSHTATHTAAEEAASAMAEEGEEEGASSTPGATEGHDLTSTAFIRGWEEEEEESFSIPTLLPNVASGIGGHGSVSHMSAFMLHFLQHDPRVQNIKKTDSYWLATILDPRYKSRVMDMLPPHDRSQRMHHLHRKLVQNILSAFPPSQVQDSAAQPASHAQPQPQGSGREGRSSSTTCQTPGGTVNFGAMWQHFFKTPMMADASSRPTQGHPARIKKMVSDYMAINFDCISAMKTPFDFWISKMDLWPELAKYAVELLSCPAASVLSERVFSCAGNILTDTRTRLSTANVDRLTQIKMNRSWVSDDYNGPTEHSDE